MRIEYSGLKADLSERERIKVERKLAKIQRILTRRDDLETQVRLSRQRHLCEAEVMLRALRHTLVVAGTGSTTFAAMNSALGKLEKQAVRNKHKIIDTHRPGRQRDQPSVVLEDSIRRSAEAVEIPAEAAPSTHRVVRAGRVEAKPMTEDEAVLLLEAGKRDYVSYRDADSGYINVLVRGRDGVADLVEGD